MESGVEMHGSSSWGEGRDFFDLLLRREEVMGREWRVEEK
jgi:hypothetical protein